MLSSFLRSFVRSCFSSFVRSSSTPSSFLFHAFVLCFASMPSFSLHGFFLLWSSPMLSSSVCLLPCFPHFVRAPLHLRHTTPARWRCSSGAAAGSWDEWVAAALRQALAGSSLENSDLWGGAALRFAGGWRWVEVGADGCRWAQMGAGLRFVCGHGQLMPCSAPGVFFCGRARIPPPMPPPLLAGYELARRGPEPRLQALLDLATEPLPEGAGWAGVPLFLSFFLVLPCFLQLILFPGAAFFQLMPIQHCSGAVRCPSPALTPAQRHYHTCNLPPPPSDEVADPPPPPPCWRPAGATSASVCKRLNIMAFVTAGESVPRRAGLSSCHAFFFLATSHAFSLVGEIPTTEGCIVGLGCHHQPCNPHPPPAAEVSSVLGTVHPPPLLRRLQVCSPPPPPHPPTHSRCCH